MTRLIAGSAGGRRLRVPVGAVTRPTADRTREALFSALGDLAGARVLDLYAGTGALGLEALSRGAGIAVLVERDPRVLAVLRDNARLLALPGAVVIGAPVARFLAGVAPAGAPRAVLAGGADLVFLDPPYAQPVDPDLVALTGGGWLAPAARVVVERGVRDPGPDWPPGLLPERDRRYGEARLWYGRRS